MSTIHFTKMHGCGNDYIYVDVSRHPIADPSRAAILWSDRHKGIGSDGLVLIDKSPSADADFSMRIFNADGSEAMMCGNASRCIGKYLFERGMTTKKEIRLHTLSGIKTLLLHEKDGIVESVTVDMLEPVFEDERLYRDPLNPSVQGEEPTSAVLSGPLKQGEAPTSAVLSGPLKQGVFVSMGNPHYVIFTDDVDKVADEGPVLECHPMFPQRCNIEFAQVTPEGIRTRVWERGSGITEACGTGACATAVAAAKTGRAGRRSTIIMDGGTLQIEWSAADNHVYMTGPAAFVFDGEIRE